MASDIFDVQPPAWLTAIAQPVDVKLTGQVLGAALAGATGASARKEQQGGSWFSNFLGAAAEAKMGMADPLWRLKANEAQLGILKDMVGIQQANTALQTHKLELANIANDSSVWPKWMQDNRGNYLRADPPNLLSTQYNQLYNQFIERQSNLENTKRTTYEVQDYYRRLDKLPPKYRGRIPALPDTGDPNWRSSLDKAQTVLSEVEAEADAERQARFDRYLGVPATGTGAAAAPAGAAAPGTATFQPYSLSLKGPYDETLTFHAPSATSTGPAATSFRQRFVRAQEIAKQLNQVNVVLPFANILGVPTPEQMDAFSQVEAGLLNAAQSAQATDANAPGARVTKTYSPGGQATTTVQGPPPAWQGPIPDPIYLPGGAMDYPRPVYQSGRITGYEMVRLNSQADRLATAQQLIVMARDIGDQLIGTTKFSKEERDQMVQDQSTYNTLARNLIGAQAPALREQMERMKRGLGPSGWRGSPFPLPETNAPTAGTNSWTLDTNGVLVPKP